MREETEAERQRRLEETRREIAAETARALEQIRAEVADLTLEATSIVVGKKLDSDRDRELISRGDRLARLLAAGGASIAVAHRIYAEALFSAAKDAGRLAQVHEALADFAAAIEQTPELRAVLRNPQLEPAGEGRRSSPTSRATTSRCSRTSCSLVAEKGRAGEIEEIAQEFERLMAREERRLTVELTTARELTDDEAQAIVAQIEQAAGRKVEATRSVDPGADRRHRAAGGLVSRRRERARKIGTTATDTREELRETLKLRPEEITSILRQRIEQYDVETDLAEVGTVLQIGDGIARIYGLENAVAMEMLELEHGVVGLAFNLEEDDVGAALFGEWEQVKEGEPVRRTGQRRERAGRRGAARPRRRPARQPARRPRPDRGDGAPAARVQGAGRDPAPAGEGAARRPASSRSTR